MTASRMFFGRCSTGSWVNLLCDQNGAIPGTKLNKNQELTRSELKSPACKVKDNSYTFCVQKGHETLRSVTNTSESKRTIKCPICDRSFTHSGHRARHMRVHTGAKPHKCLHSGCNCTFSRKDNMMQHYRTRHSSESNWKRKESKQTFHHLAK
ncbi:hypothetical protein DFJ77DRAFT_200676 [Powellomyces hirtus]|nr:hypothetical protein DFJ77DRAFT_200676 [Powellomyces hirtus]